MVRKGTAGLSCGMRSCSCPINGLGNNFAGGVEAPVQRHHPCQSAVLKQIVLAYVSWSRVRILPFC